MGKKSLTTEERELIKLLSAKGESCYAISLQVKRSPHTIKKYLSEPETSIEVQEKKQELSDMFEDVARRMIQGVTDESIEKLDAYKKTLSAGIATDKMRLLRDQSTDDTKTVYNFIREIKIQMEVGDNKPNPIDITPDNEGSLPPKGAQLLSIDGNSSREQSGETEWVPFVGGIYMAHISYIIDPTPTPGPMEI